MKTSSKSKFYNGQIVYIIWHYSYENDYKIKEMVISGVENTFFKVNNKDGRIEGSMSVAHNGHGIDEIYTTKEEAYFAFQDKMKSRINYFKELIKNSEKKIEDAYSWTKE